MNITVMHHAASLYDENCIDPIFDDLSEIGRAAAARLKALPYRPYQNLPAPTSPWCDDEEVFPDDPWEYDSDE